MDESGRGRRLMLSEQGGVLDPSVFPLPATTPTDLLSAAGYVIDQETLTRWGVQRKDPYRLAAAADVLVKEDLTLKGGEVATPSRRLVEFRPKRNDIDRENIVEGLWHVLRSHAEGSWYTHQRQTIDQEAEARALTLATLAPRREIEYLAGTNIASDIAAWAGVFGMTRKGMQERLRSLGIETQFYLADRPVSGLARIGLCEGGCGQITWLAPHHETYVRRDREWAGDGFMLCWECHELRWA